MNVDSVAMSSDKLERRSLDPAVGDIMAGMEHIAAERKLDKRKRERRKREREKAASRRAAGTRVNLDLPVWLKARLKELAAAERVPESQIVALACARLLAEIAAGSVDLTAYKEPSSSPRYEWNLRVAEI